MACFFRILRLTPIGQYIDDILTQKRPNLKVTSKLSPENRRSSYKTSICTEMLCATNVCVEVDSNGESSTRVRMWEG